MATLATTAHEALTTPPLIPLQALDYEHTGTVLEQVMEWVDTAERPLRGLDPAAHAAALHTRHPRLDPATILDVVCIDRDARLDILTNLRRALERELGITTGARGWAVR